MKSRIKFFLFCFLFSAFWFPASGYAACPRPAKRGRPLESSCPPRKRIVTAILLALFLAFLTPARTAFAACSGPTGKAADLIYNGDAHVPQYCNGVSWVTMAPTINLPTTSGLAGWWKLDDGSGTTATDSSGNGNTGTLVNSPVWTAGYYNGALNFNGTSSYINAGSAANIAIPNSATGFTWSAWVYPRSSGQGGTGNVVWEKSYLAANGSGWVGCALMTGANACAGGASLQLNSWQHLAMSFNFGTNAVNLYKNGTFAGSATGSGSIQSMSGLLVGDNAAATGAFDGLIDDVRIYNRILSTAEISTLYNYHISLPSSNLAGWWKFDESAGTAAADSSGNANNGTATGTTIVAGMIGNARSFSGTGEWVDTGDPVSGVFDFGAGQDFSFSFWLKRAASSTSEFVFAKGAGGTGDQGYAFILESGDAMKLMLSKTGESGRLGIYGANITDTNWHHVAVTLSRASLGSIYLDGVLTGSGDISGYNVSLANAARHLTIGCSSSGSLCFPGTIDDVRLYNRALSADEVYGLYRTSSPVCSNPSSYEGDVMYNKGANHVLQFCDNVGWRPLGPVPGAGGSGCTGPTGNEGDTIYSDSGVGSGVMQYCDGTNWIHLGGPNIPTSGLVGYWKFDEGTGTSAADSSGNGNTGTWSGTPAGTSGYYSAGKDGPWAGYFDGGDDYVSVPNASNALLPASNQPFSISVWLNTNNLTGLSANSEAIISNETYNVSGFRLAIVNCDSACKFLFWTSESGGTLYAISVTTPMVNAWYLVTAAYDGATASLYVNGALERTSTGTYAGNTNPLVLAHIGGKSQWSGLMDDIRIYSRALSPQEVWQIYNGT